MATGTSAIAVQRDGEYNHNPITWICTDMTIRQVILKAIREVNHDDVCLEAYFQQA